MPSPSQNDDVNRTGAARPAASELRSVTLSGTLLRLPSWTAREVECLYPGCFALVMATGIISNAFMFEGYRAVSDVLFYANVLALPWLYLATVLRLLFFQAALGRDLLNPRLVFSFFTIVAATDVFGVQLDIRGLGGTALWLWLVAFVLWFVLSYVSFGVLTFLNTAHEANVVHGGWLIAIVGTESLVLLGARIAGLTDHASAIFVLLHMLWGIGLGLYGIFIALFAYRIFFFDVEPEDVTPLLWVVMGAAAISANAGSTLILSQTGLPFLDSMRPFVDGVTLIVWAWGTWWIPLLVLLGIWKHGVCRLPIGYTPMLWSLVFPLGMYAVATHRLSLAADFPLLQSVSHWFVWVALAAWLATGAGFLASSWRSIREFTSAGSVPRG